MPELSITPYGPFGIHDTGAPAGKEDYTTVVLLHGFAWHSGVFARVVPYAKREDIRLVLVNRRGYPGATPFSDEDLQKLKASMADDPASLPLLREHMEDRARDLYNFLALFIEKENIPKKGGIIVAGWSFGSGVMISLLANSPKFPVGKIDVASYIRYVVTYDATYLVLGYPTPEDSYNPLYHPSHPPGEGIKLFPHWVSGYYKHGEKRDELEHRIHLTDPAPTISTMTEEEVGSALYPIPAVPGASDAILLDYGVKHGLYDELRKVALFPKDKSGWNGVKLRYIWCDQSVWEMPWAVLHIKDELAEAKKAGTAIRPIDMVRLRGANHFYHWDQPDLVLEAFLGEKVDESFP